MSKSKRASAQVVSQSTKERCRKGDLAIRLHGERVGHIVEVVEYHATVELDSGEVLIDAWQVRHETDDPDTDYFKEDKYLLPIRPGDLEETEVDVLVRKEGNARRCNMAKPQRALALVSPILPDQLSPIINELHEVSNLAEFLCTSVMRAQDAQDGAISLSFGESSALISLMQSVTERLVDATTNLEDIKFDFGKEGSQ